METVSIEDFKKEQKKRERKEKWEKRCKDTLDFIEEHKVAIALGISVICKVVGTGIKTYTSNKRINEERRHRDLEIYDHSTGMYLQLKRPMRADEIVYFTKRCKEGQIPKAMVLKEMNLLK